MIKQLLIMFLLQIKKNFLKVIPKMTTIFKNLMIQIVMRPLMNMFSQ